MKPEIRYLLICLMEECSEVAIEASKCLRFGPNDTHKETKGSPKERLAFEVDDILAIIDCLREHGLDIVQDADRQIDKKIRLQRAMKYSKEKGLL